MSVSATLEQNAYTKPTSLKWVLCRRFVLVLHLLTDFIYYEAFTVVQLSVLNKCITIVIGLRPIGHPLFMEATVSVRHEGGHQSGVQ